jgi:outer membrane lipoprotein-sorting protein
MGRLILGLVLLGLAPGALAADAEVLARIRAALEAQPRLRAEFEQTKRMTDVERPLVAHGRLLVWGEAGVVWEIDQPVKMAIVLREDTTTQIDAEGRRKTRRARDDAAAARIGRVLRALLHGDTATLEQWFEIAARMERSRWTITLTPRRGPMTAFLTSMQVSGERYVEHVAIDEASGDSTRIRFRNYRDAAPLSEHERGLLGVN